MKFTEKAKRFFTLSAKHEGFTLVELIVVIAILAILAGVAVPAYSGYIEKSKYAGDETLRAAVNKAFASACITAGSDVYNVKSATLTWDDGVITGVGSVNGADLAKTQEAFAMLYVDENPTAKFEMMKSLFFDSALHVWVDPATATEISVNYKGKDIVVPGETLQALINSTYGDIGSAGLLEKVEEVTGLAETMAGKLDAVFGDEDYKVAAKLALGVTTDEEYYEKSSEIVSTLINDYGMSPEDAQKQVQANAAVLYAAQNASTYDTTDLFGGKVTYADIKSNLMTDTKTAEGMAQATLVYGMYTAYANSEEYGSDELKNKDPLDALKALDDDDNFIKFVNSDQGKEDMEALRGALDVINNSTENNYEATKDLMINGFNNKELQDILGGLMG